jgi:hypothetical protein
MEATLEDRLRISEVTLNLRRVRHRPTAADDTETVAGVSDFGR